MNSCENVKRENEDFVHILSLGCVLVAGTNNFSFIENKIVKNKKKQCSNKSLKQVVI